MGLDPDVAAALATRPTTQLCKNCMPDRKGEQAFRNDCYQSVAVVGQRVLRPHCQSPQARASAALRSSKGMRDWDHRVDQHCHTIVGCNLRQKQLQQGQHPKKRCKLWAPTWHKEMGGLTSHPRPAACIVASTSEVQLFTSAHEANDPSWNTGSPQHLEQCGCH